MVFLSFGNLSGYKCGLRKNSSGESSRNWDGMGSKSHSRVMNSALNIIFFCSSDQTLGLWASWKL